MRIYRSVWTTTVVLAAVLALLVGGVRLGWLVVLGTSATLAGLGALAGLAWIEEERRARVTVHTAVWSGAATVLLLGLPSLLGGWALLVLAVLGAGCPPAVAAVLRWRRTRRPVPVVDVRDRPAEPDLERRWRLTSQELRRPGLTPAVALRLVAERQWILDELERRDPEQFAQSLVRAGWRSAGSVSEDTW